MAYNTLNGEHLAPLKSICSLFLNGSCPGSIVRILLLDSTWLNLLILPSSFKISQASEVASCNIVFDDETNVTPKEDWVKMVSTPSENQLDVVVIVFNTEAMEVLPLKHFKSFSADSAISGPTNEIRIDNILKNTNFQEQLSKCDEQMLNMKDGYIQLQALICSVEYTLQGTGSIVKIQYPVGIMRYLFMTSFHVVEMTRAIEVVDLKLVFQESSIGNLNLTPDWVKNLWYSKTPLETTQDDQTPDLDIFIIELSPIAMKVLSRTNFKPLIAEEPRVNQPVFVFQYPANDFNFAYGLIVSIGQTINYKVYSNGGSSGSPVLNKDCNVVAIHSGVWTKTGTKKAVNIQYILDAYIKNLKEHYGQNMDNILNLECINQISENARHFIGSGGYGKVYKAGVEGGGYIVVKIIEGFASLDKYKSQVEEVAKQFKLITALEDNNRLINWTAHIRDDQNAKIFIQMEYLEGGSLLDKIKNYGRLNKTCCLKYLVEILEGLKFLHEQTEPLFHNDLKPANILFTADDHIKLCDFAISTQLHNDSSVTKNCYFMSPERNKGEVANAASDIWSLGVTFVLMSTGHTINHTDSFPNVIQHIVSYEISIDGAALNEYLESLSESDYRKMIISRTLCEHNRVTAHALLELCESLCYEPPNLGINEYA